jgi:hypothetical protein
LIGYPGKCVTKLKYRAATIRNQNYTQDIKDTIKFKESFLLFRSEFFVFPSVILKAEKTGL